MTTPDSSTYSLDLYGGKELPYVHSPAGLPEGTVETIVGGRLELRNDGTWTYIVRSEQAAPSGITQHSDVIDEGTFASDGATITFTSARSNSEASFSGNLDSVILKVTHRSIPLTFVRTTVGSAVREP